MGKRKGEWFETFFSGLYGDVLAGQFSEAASLAQARLVRRLLGLRRGQKVLDVPCGQGRLTVPLARMGLAVTGVDLAPAFIRRARRRAKAEGAAARFIRGDMRRIDFDAEFHAGVNWFTSFGYFSDADNLEVAQRLFRALRPGGRLLIETMNKSFFVRHQRPRGATRTATGFRTVRRLGRLTITDHYRWNGRTSRIEAVWTFRRGRRRERRRFSLRLYTGPELRRLLRAAGFREIQLFGMPSLRGKLKVSRFTRHSMRLIALARKR
jgi:SAM-dependent methyltransferase